MRLKLATLIGSTLLASAAHGADKQFTCSFNGHELSFFATNFNKAEARCTVTCAYLDAYGGMFEEKCDGRIPGAVGGYLFCTKIVPEPPKSEHYSSGSCF